MNTYCKCKGKDKDWVFRGLHDEPLTFRYQELWVHASCCLPTIAVWEAHVRRCDGCLSMACLPWVKMCYTCWKIENPDEKYPGLLNAAKRAQKALQWPVQDSLKFNLGISKMKFGVEYSDKPLQRKGSRPIEAGNPIQTFKKLKDTI